MNRFDPRPGFICKSKHGQSIKSTFASKRLIKLIIKKSEADDWINYYVGTERQFLGKSNFYLAAMGSSGLLVFAHDGIENRKLVFDYLTATWHGE